MRLIKMIYLKKIEIHNFINTYYIMNFPMSNFYRKNRLRFIKFKINIIK